MRPGELATIFYRVYWQNKHVPHHQDRCAATVTHGPVWKLASRRQANDAIVDGFKDADLAVHRLTRKMSASSFLTAPGTFLPFAALQHHGGFWEQSGRDADIAGSTRTTHIRHGV